MEISFIIPVYNGEGCIKNCIASIQKWEQPPEIEILIINDGSTDGTEKLCEEIAEADSRVTVFSIPNSGQSVARNYGIKQCQGDYIFFADADDTVHAEEVYRLWEVAKREQADVTMGGYFRTNATGKEQVHLPGEGKIARHGTPEEQALYHKIKTESAFGYVWNKLYRKEFLEENRLQMEDIRKIYMEDQLFNLKVWSKNPVWYCVDRPVYSYETGNVSTTRKAEPQIHSKYIAMLENLVLYLRENQMLGENLDVVVPLFMRTFCWSMVKNIAYEGRSLKKMRERANAYICSEVLQQTIRMSGAWKTLFLLPSRLQALFYFFCLLLLRARRPCMIALVFGGMYFIMKPYILRVLK